MLNQFHHPPVYPAKIGPKTILNILPGLGLI